MIQKVICVLVLFVIAEVALASPGEWLSFKAKHGKEYASESEEAMRRELFEESKRMVEEFNRLESENAGYKLGLNHMSDWTKEEKSRLMGYKKAPRSERNVIRGARRYIESILRDTSKEVPDHVDWRKVEGRVTRVKDQKQCGSCWAFSTTGVLEGQEIHRIKNLTELSEQNLMDCSKENNGCDGGDMSLALSFVRSEGGIDDEKSYPYEEESGRCRYSKDRSVITTVGPAILGQGDVDELKTIVAKYGPVAIAIEASSKFQAYESGIFHDPHCEHALNHGVLIVGYGSEKGKDYWIVKNSWGPDWGEDGYIRVDRNNVKCGFADEATVAIV